MLGGGGIGGAGNFVSGANPAGTGNNINYVGNHAYLYSGIIQVNQTETTLFNTTVAYNQYIMCKLQVFNGALSNDDLVYKIKVNNETIIQYTLQQTTDKDFIVHDPIRLLLVGGDNIEVTAQNVSSSTQRAHTASLTGRVYS
jgi:hypothetical protein